MPLLPPVTRQCFPSMVIFPFVPRMDCKRYLSTRSTVPTPTSAVLAHTVVVSMICGAVPATSSVDYSCGGLGESTLPSRDACRSGFLLDVTCTAFLLTSCTTLLPGERKTTFLRSAGEALGSVLLPAEKSGEIMSENGSDEVIGMPRVSRLRISAATGLRTGDRSHTADVGHHPSMYFRLVQSGGEACIVRRLCSISMLAVGTGVNLPPTPAQSFAV